MNVLLCSLNFSPDATGIGKYSGELAEALVKKGYSVRVIAAVPFYPEWKVRQPYSSWRYYLEQPSPSLRVYRCPIFVPANPTALKRLCSLFTFALSSVPLFFLSVFWRPDIVFSVAPAIAASPVALMTAFVSRAKSWLHIQDFEVEAAFNLSFLSSVWVKRTVLRFESVVLRRFGRVSTISQKMCDALLLKGVSQDQIFLFPNWVDTENIYPLPDTSDIRRAWGVGTDKVVFLFSGTLNRKQNLQIVVDAAAALSFRKDLLFIICGDGEVREDIVARAAGATNLIFPHLQSAQHFNELLNLADVHLLPQLAAAADLVMPSKLGAMLASGRPVIVTAENSTELSFVVAGCGLVVKPDDQTAFIEAIVALADSPSNRARFGKQAREFAILKFKKETIIQSLVDEF